MPRYSTTGFEKLSWSAQSWSEVMRKNAQLLEDTYLQLQNMLDVDITGLTGNDLLQWEEASSKWKPVSKYTIFSEIILLIHSDHGHGSANITDSGGVNHTITVNGCEHSQTEEYFCDSSVYFNGSTDYLSLADHPSWDICINDFQIDFWVKHSATGSLETYMAQAEDATNYWYVIKNANDTITFAIRESSTIVTLTTNQFTLDTNWHHIVVVKEGTSYSICVDGTLREILYDSSTATFSAAFTIGRFLAGTPNYLSGYLDELRIDRGSPVRFSTTYTGTNKPALLVHSDSAFADRFQFYDRSGYNHLVRESDTNDNPWHSTSQQKFGATSIHTHWNYLYIANDNDDFNFGSGDFTIDLWVRIGSWSQTFAFAHCGDYTAGGSWTFYFQSSGELRFGYRPSGNPTMTDIIARSWSPSNNVWYHVACTRDGNSWRMFVDGTQVGTTVTDSTTLPSSTEDLWLGSAQVNGSPGMQSQNVYTDDVRILKGTAEYTTNFTAPTAPHGPLALSIYTPPVAPYNYTCVSVATSLLIHSDEDDGTTTFTDSGDYTHTITRTGTSIDHSSDTEKFCRSSLYFPGAATDYLSVTNHTSFDFSNYDMTIDLWVRFDVVGTTQAFVSCGDLNTANGWEFYYGSSNLLRFYGNSTVIVSESWTPVINTWYHVAVTRETNVWRLFVDGTQLGSGTTNSLTLNTPNNDLRIGIEYNNGSYLVPFDGYMDEIRVINQRAEYAGNFTPPTSPYSYTCSALMPSNTLQPANDLEPYG